MRAPVLILLTGLTLGATACATVEPDPASVSVAAAAPDPIDNHDWFFASEDNEAGLTYGLDESDDVWLGLSCHRGSGRLQLSRPVDSRHPLTLSLESGGETGQYPATTEPSELHDGVFLIAEAGARDPVFRQFRQTGWMVILGPDDRDAMVPHAASAPDIERFFAFCG
ncbi:MAG: hypothetical protein ACOH1E_01285 [Brevundimonas sp.]